MFDLQIKGVVMVYMKDWHENKLISVFGRVHIWEEEGYYIFMAQKITECYAKKAAKNRGIKCP